MGLDVIIMAGGLGTRLRDVVSHVPKPLAPVDGRPFLEYQMDYWMSHGATRFILSVGYRHDLIQGHFGAAYRGVPVSYAVEHSPLGTGGGLLLALRSARASGLVLAANGDTFFAVDVSAMCRAHEANKADFTMALFRTGQASRYMHVGMDASGRIRSFNAGAATDEFANGGVYLLTSDAMPESDFPTGRPLSLEADVLPAMLASGARVFGFPSDAPFIDIGVPEDYARAASVIAMAR